MTRTQRVGLVALGILLVVGFGAWAITRERLTSGSGKRGSWELVASWSPLDGYCVTLYEENGQGGACGYAQPATLNEAGSHLVFLAKSRYTLVSGPVPESAKAVEVWADGRPVQRADLSRVLGLTFFVAEIPGARKIEDIVAIGAGGDVVERLGYPPLPPPVASGGGLVTTRPPPKKGPVSHITEAGIDRPSQAPRACRGNRKVRRALRRSGGIRGHLDGDGRRDFVYFTFRRRAVLGVCLADGRFDEHLAYGMTEIFFLTDLEGDGRNEILFGGTTATLAIHEVGVVRGGRILEVRRSNGNALTLLEGLDPQEGSDVDPAHGRSRIFGCEDLDGDGIEEFVQVTIEPSNRGKRWSKVGFALRGRLAVKVFSNSGVVENDERVDFVTPCDLKSR